MDNKISLLGHYGDDLTIACSAWTSTSRELTDEKLNRVDKLINMLWSQGHHSVFEKGIVHFLVDCDIASHIHLLKHRIASINAESARYKELQEDKYYLPTDWEDTAVSGPVEVEFPNGKIHMEVAPTWGQVLDEYTRCGNAFYHACLKDLEPVLGRKRAKESARFFKAYNSQIQADVMFNMRSFANFIKLRNSKEAQKEIREIAQQMLALVENIEGEPFKYTLEAWKNNK
jgi:thymidylate synthase (FAD)